MLADQTAHEDDVAPRRIHLRVVPGGGGGPARLAGFLPGLRDAGGGILGERAAWRDPLGVRKRNRGIARPIEVGQQYPAERERGRRRARILGVPLDEPSQRRNGITGRARSPGDVGGDRAGWPDRPRRARVIGRESNH